MARGYPKKKVVWYGIYHTFMVFGGPCRSLEFIVSSKNEAEEKLKEILKEYSWKKAEDYMIEEVDVTMRAWKP